MKQNNTARLEVRVPERIKRLIGQEAGRFAVSEATVVRWALTEHYGLGTPPVWESANKKAPHAT